MKEFVKRWKYTPLAITLGVCVGYGMFLLTHSLALDSISSMMYTMILTMVMKND